MVDGCKGGGRGAGKSFTFVFFTHHNSINSSHQWTECRGFDDPGRPGTDAQEGGREGGGGCRQDRDLTYSILQRQNVDSLPRGVRMLSHGRRKNFPGIEDTTARVSRVAERRYYCTVPTRFQPGGGIRARGGGRRGYREEDFHFPPIQDYVHESRVPYRPTTVLSSTVTRSSCGCILLPLARTLMSSQSRADADTLLISSRNVSFVSATSAAVARSPRPYSATDGVSSIQGLDSDACTPREVRDKSYSSSSRAARTMKMLAHTYENRSPSQTHKKKDAVHCPRDVKKKFAVIKTLATPTKRCNGLPRKTSRTRKKRQR